MDIESDTKDEKVVHIEQEGEQDLKNERRSKRRKRRRIRQHIVLCICLITISGMIVWILLNFEHPGTHGRSLFNWHPIIMTITLLLPFRNGIINRTLSKSSKWKHIGYMTISFILFNVGIYVAYKSHVQLNIKNHFYSLHSWLGMLSIILLKSNFVSGILSIRSHHIFFGLLSTFTLFTTCLLGFNEFQLFIIRNYTLHPWSVTCICLNVFALSFTLIGTAMVYDVITKDNDEIENVVDVINNAEGKSVGFNGIDDIQDVEADTRELSSGSSSFSSSASKLK